MADWLDLLGKIRYGMPTSEKEIFARSKMAPEIHDRSADQAPSDRAASGYLFAKAHPEISDAVQPWIDAARIGWFGDSPELQSWATYGKNKAKLEGK